MVGAGRSYSQKALPNDPCGNTIPDQSLLPLLPSIQIHIDGIDAGHGEV
jgi:hypothetical protein